MAASGLHLAANLPAATRWPRITLVTPVFNGVCFIEETVRSIVYQRYPNLEYTVVDGGSTDYDALNNGFAHSTGEIMGWLNASDLLHTNGSFVLGSVFAAVHAVECLTGRPTRFNPNGMTVDIREVPSWSRYRFLAGANKYIQPSRPSGVGACGKKPAVN